MTITMFGLLVIGPMLTLLTPTRPYPACNNPAARAELAKLYDNRRLLHAVAVADDRFLNDDFSARHCVARVTWSNGSETDVRYEFDRSGRHNSNLSMWIDYNGGMRGLSFLH